MPDEGQWDSYFARVEDKVASFFVRLDLMESGINPRLSNRVWVRLKMKDPRDDGLSSASEAQAL